MDKKMLALAGAVILAIGVFLPLASNRAVSMNWIMPMGALGLGVAALVLAAIAGALAFVGRQRHVIWPGLLALGLIGFDFFRIKAKVDAMSAAQGGADFRHAVERVGLPSLSYGWVVLALGAMLLIVAGALAWRGSSPPSVDAA